MSLPLLAASEAKIPAPHLPRSRDLCTRMNTTTTSTIFVGLTLVYFIYIFPKRARIGFSRTVPGACYLVLGHLYMSRALLTIRPVCYATKTYLYICEKTVQTPLS
ncbi:hypothetical protein BJX68DRAFT_247626 [Aspergillus pseudodeflectus]|uniref:Uncharacterized protein n=1 Tax=Aspergillus pseudodeflectus TaxID=176178 RepID=A0ABR4JHM2_9EURO